MTNKEEIGVTEWIPKGNIVEDGFQLFENDETSKEKLIRKFTENPGVPLGLLATVGALTYGLFQFKKGNSLKQQYAMRARVTFQGLTFVALTYSFWIARKNDMKKREEKKS